MTNDANRTNQRPNDESNEKRFRDSELGILSSWGHLSIKLASFVISFASFPLIGLRLRADELGNAPVGGFVDLIGLAVENNLGFVSV